jgi:integrase
MSNLAPSLPSGVATDGTSLLRERLAAALVRLAPSSRRSYGQALSAFAGWFSRWLPSAPPGVAAALSQDRGADRLDPFALIAVLLRAGPLVTGHVVDAFTAATPDLASATIALRLAAIRWAVRTARDAGAVSWTLNVRSPRVRSLRDTRGPGLPAARRMLVAAQAQGGLIGVRDVALLSLLLILGLRRGEVVTLNIEHFDVEGCRIAVLGKGHQDRVWLTTPRALRDRLVAYLEQRGAVLAGAPLIASLDRARRRRDGRMTSSGIFRRVRRLARDAAVPGKVSPHRLRHTAITVALDAMRGDVRRVRQFSRHAKVETVLTYDDARTDAGGEVANVVAGALGAL